MNVDIKFRNISNKKAREEIADFILEEKEDGKKKLSTFDIVSNLELPANQVEKVLNDFEKKGKIKEINEW